MQYLLAGSLVAKVRQRVGQGLSIQRVAVVVTDAPILMHY